MAIPEPQRTEGLEAVKDFCEGRVPREFQDRVRVDFTVRGNSVTIRELRAPWREDYGPDWTVNPCAQIRYDEETQLWTLYWCDSRGRWRPYADTRPTREITWLLREVDVDSGGAFWG